MKIMQMERRIYPKRKDFTGESAGGIEKIKDYVLRKKSEFVGESYNLIDLINTVLIPIDAKDELIDEFIQYNMRLDFNEPKTIYGLKIIYLDNIIDIGLTSLKFKEKEEEE